MSATDLPPPPLGKGLGVVHLALAAVGSSALTGLILALSLAGRSERIGGEVERSVRRGIEGGVEQAMAPDKVREASAAAGRGLVGGLVDGAFDQVGGERGDALATGALDLGLGAAELGLGTLDALLGPEGREDGRARAPRSGPAPDVADVDSSTPPPQQVTQQATQPVVGSRRRASLADDAGALTGEAVGLGLGVMQDVLGVSPRKQEVVPEHAREDARDSRDR